MVNVLVIGGTGFIGSRLVKALVAEGHAVTALSRRKGSALEKQNVKVVYGSFSDLDIISATAAAADAVLHLGFNHEFFRDISKIDDCCEQDLRVVKTVVAALEGSGKLFVNTSVVTAAGDTGDTLGKETQSAPSPRAESEVVTVKVHSTLFASEALRTWFSLYLLF